SGLTSIDGWKRNLPQPASCNSRPFSSVSAYSVFASGRPSGEALVGHERPSTEAESGPHALGSESSGVGSLSCSGRHGGAWVYHLPATRQLQPRDGSCRSSPGAPQNVTTEEMKAVSSVIFEVVTVT